MVDPSHLPTTPNFCRPAPIWTLNLFPPSQRGFLSTSQDVSPSAPGEFEWEQPLISFRKVTAPGDKPLFFSTSFPRPDKGPCNRVTPEGRSPPHFSRQVSVTREKQVSAPFSNGMGKNPFPGLVTGSTEARRYRKEARPSYKQKDWTPHPSPHPGPVLF